jgi:PAS domain S-box-containing protein
VGTLIDIDDRRRAEAALRESEQRFARFMRHLPGLAWIKDERGRYVYANDAAVNAFGRTREELYGRADEEVFPPATAAQFRENDRQALAGGSVVRAVETLEHPDGVLHSSLVSKFPIPGPDGVATLVGGMAIDITEEMRTRAVLEESEERFRATFEQAAVGIAHVGTDGRWLRVNQKLCDIVGYGPDELLALTFQDITHPDDLEADLAQVRRLLAGEIGTYAMEKRYFRKDRSQVWINLTVSLVRTPRGDPKYFISVVEDITEQKGVRDALRDSERGFHELADAMPQIVYVLRPDSTAEYLNRRWQAYTGRQTADPADLQQLIHPDDLGPLSGRWEQARASGRGFDCEFRLRGASDGEYRWFLTRAVPIPGDGGGIARWYGTSTDIHAVRQAQEALRLETAKARRLVESNIIGVIFADDERILEANDAFLAMVGYTRGDLGAGLLRWREITPAEHAPADEGAVAELRRQGSCVPYQKEYYRKDGGRIPVLLGATSLDANGPPWVCFVQDMSRIKEAENELKEADRRKDEFLATLAHELRNPLAPLRSGLEVMRLAGGDAGAVERARTMMERQLAQMVRLVDDLLDISRITRGKLRLRRERVDLAGVVRSAVEGSRPLIDAFAQQLAVALPPEPVELDADPVRLSQVFANLLTNAAKYSERGGHIWLTAERRGGEVAVSVKDTGIGIDAEHLPRLFEMFSQAAPALERSQGGLGIGLSLARGLVEMHGGTIEARSEGPGKGSEFIVRLPVADRSSDRGASPAGAGSCSPTCRILVADDNRDAADSLAMMLRLLGHEVHAAYDGPEALEAAGWFRPDVALLDLGMPKLNGLEVARHIRGQPCGRGMFLVAVTGWGQEEDKRRAAEAGFDHHLTKPVEPAQLEKLLAERKRV